MQPVNSRLGVGYQQLQQFVLSCRGLGNARPEAVRFVPESLLTANTRYSALCFILRGVDPQHLEVVPVLRVQDKFTVLVPVLGRRPV